MPQVPAAPEGRFDHSLVIQATPAEVFACFFSADALSAWWQAAQSVATPVAFGVFAVAWTTTPYRDDVLGPLGGTFHGTVVDVRPGREFLVADCYWIPVEGEPLGPMALHVECKPDAAGCLLRVQQEGYESSPRWRRYYAIISHGWQSSLSALKRYAENTHKT